MNTFSHRKVRGDKSLISIDELYEKMGAGDFLTLDWLRGASERATKARDTLFGEPDTLDEDCNMMDVALAKIVLRAIAEGRCEDPKACAEVIAYFNHDGRF